MATVADNFIMSDETANGLVHGIKVGGIFGRVCIYLLLYVPISVAIAVALNLPIPVGINNTLGISIKFFGFFGFISLPFILTELAVRSWRKKNGLNVNTNIAEELKQREVNAYIAREEKAREAYNPTSDPKDLNYWFDLLEKGLITTEEYEKKKIELLS